MGDGKALQMGTSHELGPELRPGLRHPATPTPSGTLEYVWQTSWGVSTRLDRGAGHGPRRRLRSAAAAGAGARPGGGARGQGRRRASARRPDGLAAELRSAGSPGRASTTGPTPSFGRRSVDWELKGVPGAGRGRPPRPGRGHRHAGRPPPPGEAQRPPECRRGTKSPRSWPALGPSFWPRRWRSGRPGRSTPPRWRRPLRRARSASPGSAWACLGPTARTAWPSTQSRVRCLQRPDGSLAEPGDAEDDLVAVVGRSY